MIFRVAWPSDKHHYKDRSCNIFVVNRKPLKYVDDKIAHLKLQSHVGDITEGEQFANVE